MKKTVKFTLHFEATEKGAEDGPKRSSSAGVGATTHTLTFTLISGEYCSVSNVAVYVSITN